MIEVIVGVVLLVFGGDMAINAADKISKKFGISNLTIGLSLIAIMTSLPELFTNIASGMQKEGNIALGNVYGSNASNALLIGAIALFFGTHEKEYKKISNYLAIAAPAILYIFCLNSEISQTESFILLLTYILFSKTLFPGKKTAKNKKRIVDFKIFAQIAISIFLLWKGGDIAVSGAIKLAGQFGWSEVFSGLILGFGTSLPELTVTFAAVKKKNLAIISGNLIGSNIMNPLVAMPFSTISGNLHVANNEKMAWWAILGTIIYIFGTTQNKKNKKIIASLSFCMFLWIILSYSG